MRNRLIVLVAPLLVLARCSFSPAPEERGELLGSTFPNSTAPVAVEPAPDALPVEIMWRAPDVPVDGYIIRYGGSPTSLLHEAKVSVRDISLTPGPGGANFCRYILHEENAEGSPLYVTVSAVRGEEVSQPSEIIEVTQ